MDVKEFLEILQDNLEIESVKLTRDTKLNEVDEYDSLAVMSIIAITDEHFNIKLSAVQLASITTVESLIQLIGADKFTN